MARRKPSKPRAEFQTTDTGPDTPAQRRGVRYRRPKGGRPGDLIRERLHPIEQMAALGQIPQAEADRAMTAFGLFEATQRSPERTGIFVDKTPNPDLATVILVDAGFAYGHATKFIPKNCRPIYNHVVEGRNPLEEYPSARTRHEIVRLRALLRFAIEKLNV